MHKAIREHFPNLESKTEDGENPEEKVISVQYVERKSSKHGENDHEIFGLTSNLDISQNQYWTAWESENF